MAPKTAQDRPKTGPRSSWIGFFRLDFSLRFLIVFGSILVPFWPPKWNPGARLNCENRPWGGPRRSQDRLGSVLFSSCASGSLFGAHRVPLGVVLSVLGLVFCHLGLSWARFRSSWALLGSFLESYDPICPSTRQLINPSTRGSSALCNLGRRTARCD